MKHCRNEVGRWRMLRQSIRRRRRWLEDQSRRNFRIYKFRKTDACKSRRSILFVQNVECL
ncbi:YciY family protein [Xenorhabdus sp. Vera]|uniref:YciY family protein n=1 Tax=Xenorhabdus koppenhoeferi TaxID=351659 RepID=UPI0019895866|nr:YciY family protein [Xenorhabdus sp. Vera]MBD2809761.1 YciY family protein [Xenorhabdus sp. Vera]